MMLTGILALHTLASKIASDWSPSDNLMDGIKHLEGIVNKGGLHRIYDDKNRSYVWDGSQPYDTWAEGLTGRATVGHGNQFRYLSKDTRDKILAAGGADDALADQAMRDYLKWQEGVIKGYFPDHWGNLQQHQRDAIRSLYYNLGPYAKTDQLKAAVNSGQYDTVKDTFSLYDKWNGKKSYAHQLRRAREADWYEGILKSNRILPLPGSVSPDDPNAYTIQQGDTLSAIGQKHGVRWQDIAKLNPGLRANRLRLGQVIKLPTSSIPAAAPSAPAPPLENPSTYTVRAGDTLSGIARRYGTRWQDLATANPGINPDRINIGQSIKLPLATPSQAGSPSSTYTVQKGDTLSAIAKNRGLKWQDIATKNPTIHPDRIRPGDILKLPL